VKPNQEESPEGALLRRDLDASLNRAVARCRRVPRSDRDERNADCSYKEIAAGMTTIGPSCRVCRERAGLLRDACRRFE